MDEKRLQEIRLWDECLTDEERVAFIESGKAWDTGIIAKSMESDIAEAFRAKAELSRLSSRPAPEEVEKAITWVLATGAKAETTGAVPVSDLLRSLAQRCGELEHAAKSGDSYESMIKVLQKDRIRALERQVEAADELAEAAESIFAYGDAPDARHFEKCLTAYRESRKEEQ